jgi:hypothetical protein
VGEFPFEVQAGRRQLADRDVEHTIGLSRRRGRVGGRCKREVWNARAATVQRRARGHATGGIHRPGAAPDGASIQPAFCLDKQTPPGFWTERVIPP